MLADCYFFRIRKQGCEPSHTTLAGRGSHQPFVERQSLGKSPKQAFVTLSPVTCYNLISSYANCDMQLFLAQKYTMEQETSTNLYKLYKKQLQMTMF